MTKSRRPKPSPQVLTVALATMFSTLLSGAAGYGEIPTLTQLITLLGASSAAGAGVLLAGPASGGFKKMP